ncbi:MAG: hypothetical protein Q8L54_08915 [Devosia sp.]|nr:hypothetical protein [Devosia sp.]
MSRALFVVILSRDSWWVDFEGKAHGPFTSRETAAEEARHLAQFSAHSGRESEVLVPDDSGRHRVIWNSALEPYAASGLFVPHRAAE